MSQLTAARRFRAAGAFCTVGGRSATLVTYLCLTQGLYYLVTGVWPLVSIETFQTVTGWKTDHLVTGRESDHWLVMTVAVLIVAIAVTLLFAAWRRQEPVEVAVLAVGSALVLTGIDVVYVARGAIPPIYLADAAAEVVLLAAWAFTLFRQAHGRANDERRHTEAAL